MDIKEIKGIIDLMRKNSLSEFEYEKDGNDPVPGLAESVGYTRGVLASIKA